MTTIASDHVQNLFTKEKWQDLFAALSNTLGFSLSVCNERGKPLFVSEGGKSLCRRFHSVLSPFPADCENFCAAVIGKTFASGKPRLFKCYAHIMSFSLPVEHMGEKAIILGQGSFRSYDDFRKCMNRTNSFKNDPISLRMPLTFTSLRQARTVRDLVAGSVNRLLKNSHETVALQRKFESLSQDLDKKCKRFTAISELTKAITPIQNEKTLLKVILDKSAELLKAERGSLMMLDYEADVLLIEAKRGMVKIPEEKVRIIRGEGIAGKVLELGEPFLVENLENDAKIKQKNRPHYKTSSFVSVPLKIDNRTIGVINLSDKSDGQAFTEEDLNLIESIASQAAIILERNIFFNKNEELKKLTITDDLTGLLNRRYVHERLKDELARSKRHGHRLSLLMLDLDGFKYCNDTFGHLFGDQTLTVIADRLLNAVRSMDVVARYGGDEFLIILPETGRAKAIDIAERVRTTVEEKVVLSLEIENVQRMLSTSIGIVCFPEHGDTIDLLLMNADTALYRAKHMGKNRIEVFS